MKKLIYVGLLALIFPLSGFSQQYKTENLITLDGLLGFDYLIEKAGPSIKELSGK